MRFKSFDILFSVGVCPAILADQCSQGVVVSFVSVTTIQIYVIQPQGCAIIASLTHPGIIVKDVEMDGMVMPFCAPVKVGFRFFCDFYSLK